MRKYNAKIYEHLCQNCTIKMLAYVINDTLEWQSQHK